MEANFSAYEKEFTMKKTQAQYGSACLQFIKFGMVGVSNTAISLIVYYFFVFLGAHYTIANVFGFIVGTLNAYYWNNKYVFKKAENETRNATNSVVKVFISYGFTLLLSTVLLTLWVDVYHVSEVVAPIINLLVTIPLNFVLNKFWAFRSKRK